MGTYTPTELLNRIQSKHFRLLNLKVRLCLGMGFYYLHVTLNYLYI